MTPIQFKRSCQPGVQPAPCELVEGELAINLADGTLYSKDCNGNVISIGGQHVDGGSFAGEAPPSYNCVNNACVQASGNGTYATLADCEAACTAPPVTTYNCVSNTCQSVSGSGGTYSTLAACQAACASPPVTTYNCVGGSCQSVSGAGGTYSTLAACQAACLCADGPNDDFLVASLQWSDGAGLHSRFGPVWPTGAASSDCLGKTQVDGPIPDGGTIHCSPAGRNDVLVYLSRYKLSYPSENTVTFRCDAQWPGASYQGYSPVRVEFTLYRGGTPVVNGCQWANPTATQTTYLGGRSTIVAAVVVDSQSSSDYTLLTYATWDFTTRTMTFSTTPPAHTYNCVSGSCQSVSGSGGTYSTLAACQAACQAVTPSFTLGYAGGQPPTFPIASGTVVWTVQSPVLPSGATLSLVPSVNDTVSGTKVENSLFEVFYNATYTLGAIRATKTLTASDFRQAGGLPAYALQFDAVNAQNVSVYKFPLRTDGLCSWLPQSSQPSRYTYNYSTNTCTGPINSCIGYATLADCQADHPTTYNCVNGACTTASGLSGTYSTLAACQAACVSLVIPSMTQFPNDYGAVGQWKAIMSFQLDPQASQFHVPSAVSAYVRPRDNNGVATLVYLYGILPASTNGWLESNSVPTSLPPAINWRLLINCFAFADNYSPQAGALMGGGYAEFPVSSVSYAQKSGTIYTLTATGTLSGQSQVRSGVLLAGDTLSVSFDIDLSHLASTVSGSGPFATSSGQWWTGQNGERNAGAVPSWSVTLARAAP